MTSQPNNRKELDKLLREHIADDHQNCDDSCSKKADYTDLIEAIEHLVLGARMTELYQIRKQGLPRTHGINKYIKDRLAELTKGDNNNV